MNGSPGQSGGSTGSHNHLWLMLARRMLVRICAELNRQMVGRGLHSFLKFSENLDECPVCCVVDDQNDCEMLTQIEMVDPEGPQDDTPPDKNMTAIGVHRVYVNMLNTLRIRVPVRRGEAPIELPLVNSITTSDAA